MKRFVLLLTILTGFSVTAFGQTYYVTYIKGTVLYDQKPLKLHDQVNDNSKVSSTDIAAELGLFSLQKGKMKLSFVNAKPVTVTGTAHNELYQLLVGSYLQKYTSEKALATRSPEFDLQVFLNDTAAAHPANRVAILEGQSLPLKSALMQFMPTDKYFICTLAGKDTSCHLLARTNDSLVFNKDLFKALIPNENSEISVLQSLIKIGYVENGSYHEQYFPDGIAIALVNRQELQAIADSYKAGLSAYYHGDKEKLIADIEDDLSDHYGKFYKPAFERELRELLK